MSCTWSIVNIVFHLSVCRKIHVFQGHDKLESCWETQLYTIPKKWWTVHVWTFKFCQPRINFYFFFLVFIKVKECASFDGFTRYSRKNQHHFQARNFESAATPCGKHSRPQSPEISKVSKKSAKGFQPKKWRVYIYSDIFLCLTLNNNCVP